MVHGSQGGGVIASGRQCLTVEVVLTVEANRIVHFRGVDRVHGQGEGREAVAAIDVLAVLRERVDARVREGRVEAVACVVRIFAGLVSVFRRAERVHRHVQGHSAVAVVHGLQMLGVREIADLGGRHVKAVLVIGAAKTERCGNLRDSGLVYGQMQDRDAVAAVHVGSGVLVVHRFSGIRDAETVSFVSLAGADFSVVIRRLLRVVRQMQDHGAVASVGGSEVGGVVALFAHGLAVEQGAAFRADGLVKLRHENGLHGEMKDGDAVAAVDGLSVVGQLIDAVLVIRGFESVVVVERTGADFVIQLHEGGLVDGQVHRHGAVAAVGGGERFYVFATRAVSRSSPFVIYAGLHRYVGVVRGLDGQMQGHGAVATIGGGECFGVIPAFGVGHPLPHVSVAGGYLQIRVLGGFDGQMQRHDAVATVGRREGLRVDARGGVGLAVPDILPTSFGRDGIGDLRFYIYI